MYFSQLIDVLSIGPVINWMCNNSIKTIGTRKTLFVVMWFSDIEKKNTFKVEIMNEGVI